MMPAEIIAVVGLTKQISVFGKFWHGKLLQSNTGVLQYWRTGVLKILAARRRFHDSISTPAPSVSIFYSYYSSQLNCELAQNVFPYFPVIAALLK